MLCRNLRIVLSLVFISAAFGSHHVTVADEKGEVTDQVRESFEDDLAKLRVRVEKTEKALQLVKDELDRREKLMDEMIAKRVAELMSGKVTPATSDDDQDVSAEVLANEGWQAWQKRDLQTAEAKFKKALAIDPKLARALNGLGWAQLNSGKTEEALAVFEKTLLVDPNAHGAMNGVGQALIGLGRLDEAETKLTKATEMLIKEHGEALVVNRRMTASWMGLVRVYLKKGEPDQAAKWAQRYLKHLPDDPMMKAMLAEAEAAKEGS